MLLDHARVLLRATSAYLVRAGGALERTADELVYDTPAFWQKHRGRVAIFVVSASVSGVLGYYLERFSSPL
jgi:hypothetical protein